jgi:hypothetical protein
MAPPVPFVYLGKKLEGGQWEVYLGRGEEVLIVREGMALDGTYQVKSINPPTLTLLYLPLKQSQTIPLEDRNSEQGQLRSDPDLQAGGAAA